MCCPERYNDWLGIGDNGWCYDLKIKVVVFLDENIHHISPAVVGDIDESVKILSFPKSLDGCSDLNILSSVISFVKANRILITRNTRLYFATRDMGFESRSESKKRQRGLDFEIQYLLLRLKSKSHESLSRMVVARINEKINDVQVYNGNQRRVGSEEEP